MSVDLHDFHHIRNLHETKVSQLDVLAEARPAIDLEPFVEPLRLMVSCLPLFPEDLKCW